MINIVEFLAKKHQNENNSFPLYSLTFKNTSTKHVYLYIANIEELNELDKLHRISNKEDILRYLPKYDFGMFLCPAAHYDHILSFSPLKKNIEDIDGCEYEGELIDILKNFNSKYWKKNNWALI